MLEELPRSNHVGSLLFNSSPNNHSRSSLSQFCFEELAEFTHTQTSFPEDVQLVSSEFDDRAFHSELAPLSVNDSYILVPEVVEDVHRLGGTNVTKQVGTRSANRQSTLTDRLPRVGMLG